MPLSARANQTFDPPAGVAGSAGHRRGRLPWTRGAAASALAVLAVAGPVAGCAAASSSGSAATPGAAASSAAAGTPSTTPSSPGAAKTPASAASCAAGAGSSSGSGSGAAQAEAPALTAVQFVDSDHGWVAGAGRVMATDNGGASWSRQYTGKADLAQVDFIDGDHGWAAGGGTLLRTANGGASWTALAEPCQGDLSSVHFVSPTLGYAVAAAPVAQASGGQAGGGAYTTGDGGTLERSTDGGATWTPVAGAPANPQSACFGTADDGYLGTPGRIWRTTDAGQHWTLALTEPASGNPTTADTPEIQCAGASGLWVLFLGQGAATGHAPYLAYATQDGHAWHGVLEEQFTESALRPSVKLPEGPGSYPGPVSVIDPAAAVFVG